MIINKKIVEIFKPLNIPVKFMEYKGGADKYIVFSTTGDRDDIPVDDENMFQIINVGMNYYYKNPEDMMLIEDIKKILKENNFKIISSQDIHQNGSDYYNRTFYTRYVNEI